MRIERRHLATILILVFVTYNIWALYYYSGEITWWLIAFIYSVYAITFHFYKIRQEYKWRKQKMTDEKDYVEGIQLKVVGIKVLTNPYNDLEVRKVVIDTEKGPITHKPKMEVSEFRNGIEYLTIKPAIADKLPAKLVEIGNIISKMGSCDVKVCYNIWKTEKDGEEVTYRFVQHESTLNKWEVISAEKIVE